MRTYYLLFPFILLLFPACQNKSENEIDFNSNETKSIDSTENYRPVIVLHGGAGTILKENFSDSLTNAYHSALDRALEEGYKILENNGSSIDAVVKTIQILEEDSLFNAGVGAVLTHDKTISLDASIMDGNTGQAGGVAGINRVKSPIELARSIMQNSKHVMLSGTGAEEFAEQQGLEMVLPSYFMTTKELKQINDYLESQAIKSAYYNSNINDIKMGTVGCVALDKNGNLAAGTSTGGMMNKKHGRIGDSPIIGAGTFADNNTCAVSCTGHGEYFIRNVVAYDVSAKMKYQNSSIKDASQEIIDYLETIDGAGGLIAVDKDGNIAMPFNTKGMFRAYKKWNGEKEIKMFKE